MRKAKLLQLLVIFLLSFTAAFTYKADWVSIRTDHFSIAFPGQPEENHNTAYTAYGNAKTTSYSVSSPDNDTYLLALHESVFPENLSFSDNPETTDSVFKGNIGQIAHDFQGQIKSEKNITSHGYPGREARIYVEDGMQINARVFVAKNRLYHLICYSTTKEISEKEMNKFLNSFSIWR